MLSELNVRSYGLIKELSWQPEKGLNVITGETGSGKSMVLDAFEALLDGRITEDEIKYGEETCKVEAIINCEKSVQKSINSLLTDKGLDIEDDSLLLTSDIKRHGRTVSRVNGCIAQKSILNDLHSLLVDIHGQSQHLSLYDKANHLGYLDDYGGLIHDREQLGEKFRALSAIRSHINDIKNATKNASDSRDLLSFQIEEIENAHLDETEEEELLSRRDILSNAEKLRGYVYEIGHYLTDDDNGSAETVLGHALNSLQKLAAIDNSLESAAVELENASETISSIAYQISDYGDNLEFDPRELENLEERLMVIKTMKRKYGPNVKDVLNYLEEAKAKLSKLDSADFNIEQLEIELKNAEKEYIDSALNLSNSRKATAMKMKEAVAKELKDLEMPHTVFDIKIVKELSEDGLVIDGEKIQCSENGIDNVEFMVSQVPLEPLKPLAEVASTGEISRFTLAIKSALAASDKVPILIFDEIDIGVGGRTGDVLGRKLWELSRHHQVICVTHLAQIACYADAHFSVSKMYSGDTLDSTMVRLNEQEHLEELALMLGGGATKESSLEVADELSKSARLWKSSHIK